jgi:hypothetical protein
VQGTLSGLLRHSTAARSRKPWTARSSASILYVEGVDAVSTSALTVGAKEREAV